MDVVRAIRRFLLLRWLSSVDDARTRLCGKARAPLRQLTPLPRADQVLLSRCRTDSLPDLGTYRLRLGIASSPACRWCAGLPLASMDTVPPVPLPAAPRSPARQALPEAPDTFPCPHCPVTLAHASSLRRHMDNAHPGDPRPAHSPFVCPCGKAFTSNKGRANRHRTCASRMQLHPPEQARPPDPPTRSLESIPYLLCCPALATGRPMGYSSTPTILRFQRPSRRNALSISSAKRWTSFPWAPRATPPRAG